jgi:hypothetical protein
VPAAAAAAGAAVAVQVWRDRRLQPGTCSIARVVVMMARGARVRGCADSRECRPELWQPPALCAHTTHAS